MLTVYWLLTIKYELPIWRRSEFKIILILILRLFALVSINKSADHE